MEVRSKMGISSPSVAFLRGARVQAWSPEDTSIKGSTNLGTFWFFKKFNGIFGFIGFILWEMCPLFLSFSGFGWN